MATSLERIANDLWQLNLTFGQDELADSLLFEHCQNELYAYSPQNPQEIDDHTRLKSTLQQLANRVRPIPSEIFFNATGFLANDYLFFITIANQVYDSAAEAFKSLKGNLKNFESISLMGKIIHAKFEDPPTCPKTEIDRKAFALLSKESLGKELLGCGPKQERTKCARHSSNERACASPKR